jgi:uncharacterized protein YjeT (DUF2065 family)
MNKDTLYLAVAILLIVLTLGFTLYPKIQKLMAETGKRINAVQTMKV